MVAAKHQILLIGWDFDARIRLGGSEPPEDDGPEEVGDFISWLIERTPTLNVYLLRWDVGALKSLTRGKTALTVLNWMRHDRIHTKLDGHHPTGASHHQKIVVIDDCLAFCGGIDMTAGRWDTRAHRDDDPLRVLPNGDAYEPWHDATTALQGPVAAALGELSRDRWAVAGGDPIDAPPETQGCWPDGLPVDFTDLPVAIARTVPEMDDQQPVHEIESLYLAAIASAKRFIYAESQYFASRRVAEAIGKRLQEPDGPEIVIINPESADGWLEPLAMDTARARLVEALRRRDPHRRLRLFLPFTAKGEAIYVHAKVLVVDERLLRVGSSNFNNRSMRLDTECDVALTAGNPATAACIARIRDGLIAEHLGRSVDEVAESLATTGSLIATIEQLRGPGRTLRDYVVPELSSVEEWLADNEVLDPENPDDMFEATTGGLLRGLARRVRGG
ncbi:phospholipase D-like domain-containing protein [Sphingomonas donggukensis]|uniref:Phospholipase D n=1 Tax=Sphingomonas donggukensis TaxID=2949093 RepID=A0ABY4U0T9_9SPHN|nr:phospholipase D-like domain-containing protein [Sphingomonas donggukensis]URW76984.1 phospholipase D-like domain-containing protein [Sphingomonas donggukensis]